MQNLTPLRDQLHSRVLAYTNTQAALEKEQIAFEKAEATQASLLEIQELLQHTAQAVQTQAHQRIASLVTEALRSIFEEDAPTFHIEFERKRGKTEAVLLFKKGELILSPLEASGGGVVDVAAFALRLAALTLAKPRRRRLLLLDEPFRFVSRDYLPRVRLLLERLATELDIQIVLVTHLPQLQSSQPVELSR